jgi:hypothetical protein
MNLWGTHLVCQFGGMLPSEPHTSLDFLGDCFQNLFLALL